MFVYYKCILNAHLLLLVGFRIRTIDFNGAINKYLNY